MVVFSLKIRNFCLKKFEVQSFLTLIVLTIYITCSRHCASALSLRSLFHPDEESHKEHVEVRFITKLRHKRDIDSRDFHVIQLIRPHRNNSKMNIHLHKDDRLFSSNFQFVVNDGKSRRVIPELSSGNDKGNGEGHCLFTGVISTMESSEFSHSSSFSSFSSHSETMEHVAFTGCGEHPGFTGVIMSREGTFILEPKKLPVSFRRKRSITVRAGAGAEESPVEVDTMIPHTLSLLDTSKEDEAIEKCAGAIEPPERLLIAVPSSESSEDEEKSENNTETSETAVKTPIAPKLPSLKAQDGVPISRYGFSWSFNIKKPSGSDNWVSDSDSSSSSSSSSFSSSSSRGARTSSKKLSQTKTVKSAGGSSKKPIHDTKEGKPVVELKIFGDASFYEEMKTKLRSDSVKAVKNYMVICCQMMAILYEHPSLKTPVTINLVGIELMTKDVPGLNIEKTHGELTGIIDEFCHWASKFSEEGRAFDHAMLFTATDLRVGSATDAVGVAYSEGLCTLSLACSVIENKGFNSAGIMAHELGHSFGMQHDGEEMNTACSNSAFLMAAISQPMQTSWSSCSNENMQKFLSGKPKIGRQFYRNNCLEKESSNPPKFKFSTKKNLPGEKVNADQQCLIQFGKSRSLAVSTNAELKRYPALGEYEFCKAMFCQSTDKMQANFAHAPLEGTQCGEKKWCRKGECVKHT